MYSFLNKCVKTFFKPVNIRQSECEKVSQVEKGLSSKRFCHKDAIKICITYF